MNIGNGSLCKLNVLDSDTLDDLKYYMPPVLAEADLKTDMVEYEYFGKDEKENSGGWTYPAFSYRLNQYGFRQEGISKEADIGAFGCSYTFGQGMPAHMLYHNLIASKFNKSVLNFGIPGASILSIVDVFCIVTKHTKIKTAIMLLPPVDRIQIAKYNEENKLAMLTLLPNNRSLHNRSYGIEEHEFFKVLPEDEIVKQAKNAIYMAELVAKVRDIKLYISAWEYHTHQFLKRMSFNYITLLPQWHNTPKMKNDLARDGRHPGPMHHEYFTEIILPHIEL